jgi:hypothetical protein
MVSPGHVGRGRSSGLGLGTETVWSHIPYWPSLYLYGIVPALSSLGVFSSCGEQACWDQMSFKVIANSMVIQLSADRSWPHKMLALDAVLRLSAFGKIRLTGNKLLAESPLTVLLDCAQTWDPEATIPLSRIPSKWGCPMCCSVLRWTWD